MKWKKKQQQHEFKERNIDLYHFGKEHGPIKWPEMKALKEELYNHCYQFNGVIFPK